jgi:uncharacterized DUF497 family protein
LIKYVYIIIIYIMTNENIIEVLRSEGFDWNEGNREKNKKHGVENVEIEELFFNPPFIILPDTKHSNTEERYFCFGTTYSKKKLLIVFTVRDGKIRPISARAMNAKERKYYEEKTKTGS